LLKRKEIEMRFFKDTEKKRLLKQHNNLESGYKTGANPFCKEDNLRNIEYKN
jgi:hypothetical protein